MSVGSTWNGEHGPRKIEKIEEGRAFISTNGNTKTLDVAPVSEVEQLRLEDEAKHRTSKQALPVANNEEARQARIAHNQLITGIISKDVFKNTIAKSIRNDAQKVLDANESGDVETLKAIQAKYAKDAGRNQVGGGAGPGKIGHLQPRRGAEPVFNAGWCGSRAGKSAARY